MQITSIKKLYDKLLIVKTPTGTCLEIYKIYLWKNCVTQKTDNADYNNEQETLLFLI